MNDALERLIDLLIIHEGHCAIVVNSPIYSEALKLEKNGCISFRAGSMGMIEVHYINRTKQTNRKALLLLKDELRKQYET